MTGSVKKPVLEEVPVFDLKALRRGKFSFDATGEHWTYTLYKDRKPLGDIIVTRQVSAKGTEWLDLDYIVKDKSSESGIQVMTCPVLLDRTGTGFGGQRVWLRCPASDDGPECSRRVQALYMVRGANYFKCRHCLGLSYLSQTAGHLSQQKDHNGRDIDEALLQEMDAVGDDLAAMGRIFRKIQQRRWFKTTQSGRFQVRVTPSGDEELEFIHRSRGVVKGPHVDPTDGGARDAILDEFIRSRRIEPSKEIVDVLDTTLRGTVKLLSAVSRYNYGYFNGVTQFNQEEQRVLQRYGLNWAKISAQRRDWTIGPMKKFYEDMGGTVTHLGDIVEEGD